MVDVLAFRCTPERTHTRTRIPVFNASARVLTCLYRRYARAELAAELAEYGIGVGTNAALAKPNSATGVSVTPGALGAAVSTPLAGLAGTGAESTPVAGWFGWMWGSREAAPAGTGNGAAADGGDGVVLTDAQKGELLRLLADDVPAGSPQAGHVDPSTVISLWTINIDLVEVGVRSSGTMDAHVRAECLTCTLGRRTSSYRLVSCGNALFVASHCFLLLRSQDLSLASLDAVDDAAAVTNAPFAAIVSAKAAGRAQSRGAEHMSEVGDPAMVFDRSRAAVSAGDAAKEAFLRLSYETFPPREAVGPSSSGARAEASLSLSMKPLEVVYSAPLMSRLGAFLASPSAGDTLFERTRYVLSVRCVRSQTFLRSSRLRLRTSSGLCENGRNDDSILRTWRRKRAVEEGATRSHADTRTELLLLSMSISRCVAWYRHRVCYVCCIFAGSRRPDSRVAGRLPQQDYCC